MSTSVHFPLHPFLSLFLHGAGVCVTSRDALGSVANLNGSHAETGVFNSFLGSSAPSGTSGLRMQIEKQLVVVAGDCDQSRTVGARGGLACARDGACYCLRW